MPFQVVKSKTGPFFPAEIYVTGNPALNYEDATRKDHRYKFQLVATDGAHPAVRSDVFVEVTNANDEKPVYDLSTITLTVNRDSINSVIYQVQASDPDGSTVRYAFKGKKPPGQHWLCALQGDMRVLQNFLLFSFFA